MVRLALKSPQTLAGAGLQHRFHSKVPLYGDSRIFCQLFEYGEFLLDLYNWKLGIRQNLSAYTHLTELT